MSAKNIFICYRRDDTEGSAGRLYDWLNKRFPGRIFIDVTGISPGEDFLRVIQERVGSCHVLIAIIGRHWATVTDAENRRRLDLPDDYVRHEIATALVRKITVIPVLVKGAKMPSPELLPPDLAELSTRNALEITGPDFDHDVGRLIQRLEHVLGEPPITTPPIVIIRRGHWWRNCLIISLIGVLAVVVIIFVLILLRLLSSSQNNRGIVQPTSNPEYSRRNQRADAVNFHPVGHWIVTVDGEQVSKELVIREDNTCEFNGRTYTWEYFPDERKLRLGSNVVFTIESQTGSEFVGRWQVNYTEFRARLTRN